jgi:predicted site-specific integrase-resolvase
MSSNHYKTIEQGLVGTLKKNATGLVPRALHRPAGHGPFSGLMSSPLAPRRQSILHRLLRSAATFFRGLGRGDRLARIVFEGGHDRPIAVPPLHATGSLVGAPAGLTLDIVPAMPRRVRRRRRRAVCYVRVNKATVSKCLKRQRDDCVTYANGLDLQRRVKAYSDTEGSGLSLDGRPGLEALLEDAGKGLFDLIVVEALDVLSRDMAGLMHVYRLLEKCGVELHDVRTGRLDLVHFAISGYMSEEQRRHLAERRKRVARARTRRS